MTFPTQDTKGRWRCALCPRTQRRWRPGTLRDSLHHYMILHHDQEAR